MKNMKTKHTAGPWTVCKTTMDGEPIAYHICDNQLGTSEPICFSSSYIRRPADELMANASLIAAAPDLLAALQMAREALEQASSPACFNPHRVAIRAAIAKANGNA